MEGAAGAGPWVAAEVRRTGPTAKLVGLRAFVRRMCAARVRVRLPCECNIAEANGVWLVHLPRVTSYYHRIWKPNCRRLRHVPALRAQHRQQRQQLQRHRLP